MSPRRRPGRPLLGEEPLDARLTVLVTASMKRKLLARPEGEAMFVRKALARALVGGVVRARMGSRKRKVRGPGRPRRFLDK